MDVHPPFEAVKSLRHSHISGVVLLRRSDSEVPLTLTSLMRFVFRNSDFRPTLSITLRNVMIISDRLSLPCAPLGWAPT